jgi:tRNA(Ile)-lysidine synthase
MIDKINNTIKHYSMVKKGDSLLLCVSGGPDSIAMLYAFISIAKDMHLRLFIAHVNHSLRGIESDKDQRYVENTASALNIPVICSKVDTIELSKAEKISVEAAGRKLRYDFFINTAEKLKIKTIATAHTKDDQAETVLMRLIRGTGPRGLCGIPVINHINGIKITRPLIDISRKEVLEYLSSEKIRPRIDLSNTEIKFFRNKIRLKLMPALQRAYNPDIKNVFSSLAELMQGDFEYLESVYKKTFKQLAKIKKRGEVVFRLCDIKNKPVSIKRGLIRNAIEFITEAWII